VLFAAGMATKGPAAGGVAIYSTFLQGAPTDQIIHDPSRCRNLPVTFCMDRAGLSPKRTAPRITGSSTLAHGRRRTGTGVLPRLIADVEKNCRGHFRPPGWGEAGFAARPSRR